MIPEIILKNSNKSSQIITRTEKKPAPAKWFAEVVLMSQLWAKSGLGLGLKEKIRIERGRMGVYEVIDFVLVMLSYSISQELNLKKFFILYIAYPFLL
ncbi:MAG: hypothetical protein FD167_1542 [bacterium]|nr:MAG: hypothetical protein FD167_1542 [bacterium]